MAHWLLIKVYSMFIRNVTNRLVISAQIANRFPNQKDSPIPFHRGHHFCGGQTSGGI